MELLTRSDGNFVLISQSFCIIRKIETGVGQKSDTQLYLSNNPEAAIFLIIQWVIGSTRMIILEFSFSHVLRECL